MRKLTYILLGALLALGVGAFAATGGKLGAQLFDLYTLVAGEDQTLNQIWTSNAGTGCLISSATSTTCKPSAGEVAGFYVNSTTSGTLVFYDDNDGTCSSSAKTGTITPAVGWHPLPLKFASAICVLSANTINATVVFR